MSGKSQFSEWSPERVAAMSARNRAARGREIDPVYSAAHRPAQATLDVSTAVGDELADDSLDRIKVTPNKRKPGPKEVPQADEAKAWPVFEAMLRAAKLPAPQYEFRFDPVRKWRFDVAFPEHRIAVEIDGGIWRSGGGAHSHPTGILRDMEKGNAAQIASWVVLRYTPDNLARAVDDLKLLFQSRGGHDAVR